jgi:hypothetical protein
MNKKIVLFTLALLTGLGAYAQKNITWTFDLADFNAIDASYFYEVEVTKGDKCTLTIEAPDDIMDELAVIVSDSELQMGVSREWWRTFERTWKKEYRVKAYVTMPDLVSVDLNSAASLRTVTPFSPKNFKIDLSGASSANVSVMTHTAQIKVSGASELNINGLATRSEIYVSGASTLHFRQDADYIKVKASGASTVIMDGSATTADMQAGGASNIKAYNFETDRMTVDCSGASNADVLAKRTISAKASGASNISVKGNPKFTASHSSGASSIRTR